MKNLISRRSFIAASLFVGTLSIAAPLRVAFAHEAPCPFCDMTITQDTPTQDNEVALRAGRKRIEYKCVYCAIADAKTEYKGDVTIAAPSEKKGQPVVIKRTGDKWSATPATAYFVNAERPKHRICQVQYRAFTSKAAAQAYIDKNKDNLGNVSPLDLSQMITVAK